MSGSLNITYVTFGFNISLFEAHPTMLTYGKIRLLAAYEPVEVQGFKNYHYF